jgi:hypothetical protein
MSTVHLARIDPARNMRRFYRSMYSPICSAVSKEDSLHLLRRTIR